MPRKTFLLNSRHYAAPGPLLLEIGACRRRRHNFGFRTNRLQTELGVASLNVLSRGAPGARTTLWEFDRRAARSLSSVWKTGKWGVDYGSDLDVVLVYDSLVQSPVASLSRDEVMRVWAS